MIRIQNMKLTVACTILVAILTSIPLRGQITMGGIAGTVTDPAGAVVKDAAITLTNEATQVVQTTRSTSTGTYVFPSVPVGSFTLKVNAPGFKTYVDTGIQIHVQDTVTADVRLTTGMVTQQVTVTSAVPLLQAQNASLGQTVPTAQINDLPLATRNPFSLTEISAGSYSTGGPDNPGTVFADGAEPGQVDYRLNGVDDNNEVFGGYNLVPIPDAVQEFKMQEGDNSAQFGQFAGTVVNAVVKSGTNHVNGDLFEYLRNEDLNADDYFSNRNHKPRPEYRQNQFGGTIGGPIYIPRIYDGRDKSFFFFDYQYTGITQVNQYTETVPTTGMQGSGFQNLQDLITDNSGSNTDALGRVFSHGTVLDPATIRSVAAGAVDPVSGFTNTSSGTVYVSDPFYSGGSVAGIQNFTGRTSQLNIIPQGRLDPNAVKLLSQFPAQTSAGLINNYFINAPYTETEGQYDLRIDENITQKDLLWGVFSHYNSTTGAAQPFPGAIGEAAGTQNDFEPHNEVSLNYTHVFSPTLENVMNGGYDHEHHVLEAPTADTLGIPAQYGIQGIPQILGNGGLPNFSVSSIAAFGGHGFRPTIQTTSALQFMDNLTKIHGSHEFNMGFDFNHIRGNILQPGSARGVFSYNGQYSDIPNKNSSIVGIAGMLLAPGPTTVPNGISNLGSLSSTSGSDYAATEYVADYYAGYFQDDWRVTPNLTLNLGLRWEYFSPYGESNGRQANFIATGGNGPGGIYYIPQKGCSVPRSASFNTLMAADNIQIDCVSGLAVNKAQKDNFGPRFGFAYRALPNLVMRGAYGIAYGSFDSVGYGNTLGTNYPFEYTVGFPSTTSQVPELLPNGQTATMENTYAAVNLSNPAFVSGQNLYMFGKQYNYDTPMVQTANLAVQDQFTNRDSIEVGYVGTFGRNLDVFGNHNAPTEILPPGINSQPYLPIPTLAGGSQFLQSIGVSNYDSMQTTYQHQFKNNLVLLANYTYGKCMSDDSGKSGLGGFGFRAEWLPGFGIKKDYALCGGDATNLIHVSGEYELPIGRGSRFLSNAPKWVDALIGGWYFNYIYTYQSGQPFTVGCPVATTSDFGCDANLVPGVNPYAGPHNQAQWLNPAAFGQPPAATAIGETSFFPLGSAPDQVRGPGFYNLDSSIFKTFATGKGTSMQFRLETFNTLNNPQFSNPGQLNFTNLTNFSEITGLRSNPRYGQVAAKLFF